MSYFVYAYLTEADKVKSIYGACDDLLMNQLKASLKQELDRLNEYFSDSLNTDKDAYAALADIGFPHHRFASRNGCKSFHIHTRT